MLATRPDNRGGTRGPVPHLPTEPLDHDVEGVSHPIGGFPRTGKSDVVTSIALPFHLLDAFYLVSGAVVAAVALESARRRQPSSEITTILELVRVGAILVDRPMHAEAHQRRVLEVPAYDRPSGSRGTADPHDLRRLRDPQPATTSPNPNNHSPTTRTLRSDDPRKGAGHPRVDVPGV